MPEIQYEVLGGEAVSLSMERYITHLETLEPLMMEAMGLVYEATAQWFDSSGEGSWPVLAPSTLQSKVRQGAPEPSKPLYRWGNLRASVTSSTGPYSFVMPMLNGVAFGVNWKPAQYLDEGVRKGYHHAGGAGVYGVSSIPPRPIWPPAHSVIGMGLLHEVGLLLLHGNMGTSTHPRY